jgi:alkylation response protein AidB-like acyl-CoA dehydrogenase
LRHGTPEQKRTIVEVICRGGLEAIALSEPGAGSDLGAVRTRADRQGDAFVLNGQKTWTSAAHVAEHILLLARTDSSGNKHQGLTLFMVPTGTPGLDIREIETMEARTVNDVFLTDVVVPADSVVGQVGMAWRQLMRGLSVERLIIAAMALGGAERALGDLLVYVKQREQFDRPIGTFQAVRHRIADLATEIAVCRSFVYDVASGIDGGHEDDLALEASMAKLKCTETAKHAALEAMQLMGGYGYACEYGMEEQVRKALAPPIYGGTNEIQREIIGKSFGL